MSFDNFNSGRAAPSESNENSKLINLVLNMVGVPGRSKGCATCKKRKIACTLEKPNCMNCEKSNRVCGGYERERVFVYDHRIQKEVNSVTAAIVPKGKQNASTSGNVENNTRASKSPNSSPFLTLSTIKSPSNRAAFGQQILNDFLCSSVPASGTSETQLSSTRLGWISMLPTLPSFTPSLEAAIMAVCISGIGRLNNDKVLVRESLKFYGQGLWELQKALWNPKVAYKEENLAACMSLLMYEAVECPDRNLTGWISHVKGLGYLFKLRGPKAYSTEFSHQLFLAFKQIEAQEAIAFRRSSFLASPEWMTEPWKGYEKLDVHRLQDLMAEMSCVIENGYQRLATPTFEKVNNLIGECWRLDGKLSAFLEGLEACNVGPLYWATVSSGKNSPINGDESRSIFPFVLHFRSVETAQSCIVFWALCAILWSGMKYAYLIRAALTMSYFSAKTPTAEEFDVAKLNLAISKSQLQSLGHREKPSLVAKQICQSLEYFWQNGTTTVQRAAVFPLKVAIETLNDDPECSHELAWALAAMGKASGGLRIMSHFGVPLTDHAFVPG